MATERQLIVPENQDGFSFECPDCGAEVQPPNAGNIWKCHEVYGGCGQTFKPVRAFSRMGETDE